MARNVIDRELSHLMSAKAHLKIDGRGFAGPSPDTVFGDGDGAARRPHQVGGRMRFGIATQSDDAEIRRLLRENPMAGAISLSLEREPDYFADADLEGEAKQTIIAREGERVVCAGSCVVRERFVNGKPCRVGYLGGLRLDARWAGRFDILRRGYGFFREVQAAAPADFYFTSVASDNERARWFLERGLPGMPKYEFVGEFVTVLLSTRGRGRGAGAHEEDVPAEEVVALLNEHNRRYQFAPFWTEAGLKALEPLGLRPGDFYVGRNSVGVVGAGIWDQRVFKQTVIRGYATPLRQARPVLNFAGRLARGVRLPKVGETVANALVVNLTGAGKPEPMVQLVKALLGIAEGRGVEMLTLGLAANDVRLAWLQKYFRGREYRSRLYLVRWPEFGGAARDLDGRILSPEVAWL